jgi:signal transduction histidine kinase
VSTLPLVNDVLGATRRALGGLRTFAVGADRVVRPRTRFGRALTVLLAVLAFPIGLGSYAFLDDNSVVFGALAILASAATVAPLALLTRPLLAWRIAWVAAIAFGLLIHIDDKTPWPWQPVQVVVLIVALFNAGLWHGRVVVVWTWLSAVVLVVAFVNRNNIAGLLFGATLIIVVGDQIRRRREAQHSLAAEQERSELEQARRAILEERTRIARELHDVVAHHMSLIAVRAETAPYRLAGVPAPVAEEFTAIAETSREALVEMRRLLGVLRSPTQPETQPQPGLGDLPGLVATVREAGVDAALDVDPELRVPPGIGLCVYRIAQEALSNARRHASGAPVRITVRAEGSDVILYVVNGPGVPSEPGIGNGTQGLVGMRERAAVLSGTLVAGPTAEGGFAVHATLPTTGEA